MDLVVWDVTKLYWAIWISNWTVQEVSKLVIFKGICKVLSNPITGLDRPWGFQEVEDSRFKDSRHMKVVRFLALHTSRLYPPGNIPGTHFCQRLSRPQGHSASGRIMSMKNSNDTIGNRTLDFPACSAVLQPINRTGKLIKLPTQAPCSTLLQLKLIVILLPRSVLSCSSVHVTRPNAQTF